jgi:hypothetical protein
VLLAVPMVGKPPGLVHDRGTAPGCDAGAYAVISVVDAITNRHCPATRRI